MTRPHVMGIVNVTPDSFSDGGLWATPDAAVARAHALVADGADVIDVGGESTRPGAPRVEADTELARVLPVVAALAAAGVTVSVDTTRATVAAEALASGASVINDVSGGLADPAMLATVAEAGATYIAMHWRGPSSTMAAQASYPRGVADIVDELAARRDACLAAGIAPERLVLDPGIGFSKTAEHNWAVLREWGRFEALGHPLLLAVSRKRFLGALLGGPDAPRPPEGRDAATAALSALFAHRGLWGVRVHAVRATADALAAARALAGDGHG
ncbi:dihydropteroate synthase [Propioniciclava soli]|uniref:dihydropteroate synthase n=1 Tax=Propioniciclava soli TaxID=2775081 RepID=UPI001E5DF038